jgi:hypothetical protein
MAAVIGVVSFVSSVLGIVGFVQNNLPAAPDSDHSSLRIAVGLSESAQGNTPYIAVFNEHKEFAGYWDWTDYLFGTGQSYINLGSFVDISVTQSCPACQPGQQATYVQLYQQEQGADAICIAYLSQTWADGGHRGWLGDIGRLCGAAWYYSDIIVGDTSNPYKVRSPISIIIRMTTISLTSSTALLYLARLRPHQQPQHRRHANPHDRLQPIPR